MPINYQDIVDAQSRIRARLAPTPLIHPPDLDLPTPHDVHLKCELLQVTGSFKPRGVLNWLATATEDELARGLATVSAGNHALALAWGCRTTVTDLKVVMPEGSSPMKVAATRAFGAEVILSGDINDAWAHAAEIVRSENRVLVHPFDDPRIMAGQGTVGLEILQALPDVATVLCPVGGGGLVSGIALAVKHRSPKTRVIGLEAAGAPTLRSAWDHGGPVTLESVETAAPSLGANRTGDLIYAVSRKWVDDVVVLPEADIRDGVRQTLAEGRLFAEPGAVLGIAALRHERLAIDAGPIVVVVTGGNFDFALARSYLD